MTDIATIKATRKAITKIKALTANIVHSAEYWNSSAGRSLHYYNQAQGEAALKRKRTRLLVHMRKLREFSYEFAVDVEAGRTIRTLCDVTEIILSYCDHFPRDREWSGIEPMRRHCRLIVQARAQLKRRPA